MCCYVLKTVTLRIKIIIISQAEWVKLWQKALKVNCGTAEKRLVRDNPYQLPKKKWVYKANWAKRY